MKKHVSLALSIFLVLAFSAVGRAQLGMFSKQQLIEFTPDWHGARFPDGRPDVPDFLLQRLKDVTAEEAWEVLTRAGYRNQFANGWQVINPSNDRLIGRAVTAVFMPYRPDVDSVIRANGKKEGDITRNPNSWIINRLQPGDVMVVDVMRKLIGGGIVGSNLATSVFTKEHSGLPVDGLIVNGTVRDTAEIEEIKGFEVFCRGTYPGLRTNTMVMGINVPIRFGQTIVMPGDIAVSDPEGITFIPPQFVEQVADHAELDHLVDDWGEMMLREQKYTPGQIDGRWTNEMIDEFNRWAASKGSKLRRKKH
jgi:4-hydroxy-4-methyl-2-oxoglutarate aldolase